MYCIMLYVLYNGVCTYNAVCSYNGVCMFCMMVYVLYSGVCTYSAAGVLYVLIMVYVLLPSR